MSFVWQKFPPCIFKSVFFSTARLALGGRVKNIYSSCLFICNGTKMQSQVKMAELLLCNESLWQADFANATLHIFYLTTFKKFYNTQWCNKHIGPLSNMHFISQSGSIYWKDFFGNFRWSVRVHFTEDLLKKLLS